MRSDREGDQRERGLDDEMKLAREEEVGAAARVDAGEENQLPERRARRGGEGEPQPVAQPREPIGAGADDRDIEDDGQGVRFGGSDEQRRAERADEAEPGERGAVQRGEQHRGESDAAHQQEGCAGADEAVERMGGVERAEGGDGAGGGQDGGDRRDGGRAFVALAPSAQIFARREQRQTQQQPAGHPRGGAEPALIDRIFDQQQRAERERDAADEHRPMRPEPLLESDDGRGGGRRGERRLRRRGAPRRRENRLREGRLRDGEGARGLDLARRRRRRRIPSARRRERRGDERLGGRARDRRRARLERGDPRLQRAQARAGAERQEEAGRAEKEERQPDEAEQDEVVHAAFAPAGRIRDGAAIPATSGRRAQPESRRRRRRLIPAVRWFSLRSAARASTGRG